MTEELIKAKPDTGGVSKNKMQTPLEPSKALSFKRSRIRELSAEQRNKADSARHKHFTQKGESIKALSHDREPMLEERWNVTYTVAR